MGHTPDAGLKCETRDFEKVAALADYVERLETLTLSDYGFLEDQDEEVHVRLFNILKTARSRLIACLAYTEDMLVGAELCDGCENVLGVVTRIDREPELRIITTDDCLYPSNICMDTYFRLPGSSAYGEGALVELARERVASAAQA